MNEVLFEVRSDGVAIVTLNRPERKNALSTASAARLREIWQEVDERTEIRVLVITSTDCGVFCAGMDLAETAQIQRERGLDVLQVLADPFYERLRAVRKPVIAALNGHFTAAGMVLAANSDLRVGLAGTRAGITEARVGRGTPWAAPMLTMLPQAILLEMLLTADMMPVARLHEVGFLNYLEPTPAAVRERALALAGAIVRNAPLSIVAAKAGLRQAAALGADAGFAASKELHQAVYASADAQEGPRAFTEKRAPLWQGK
jgi:enoyl-CoA hydratase/carnithine racemase